MSAKYTLANYMYMNNQIWKSPTSSRFKFYLILKENHLVVRRYHEAFESLDLSDSSIKFSYQDLTMVFADIKEDKYSKFRVLFMGEKDANECLESLGNYVDVEAILNRNLVDFPPNEAASKVCSPETTENISLEEKIKKCIFDPNFMKLVKDVEKIINSYK